MQVSHCSEGSLVALPGGRFAPLSAGGLRRERRAGVSCTQAACGERERQTERHDEGLIRTLISSGKQLNHFHSEFKTVFSV